MTNDINGLALVNGKAKNLNGNPWTYSEVKNGHVYLNHHSLPLTFFDNAEVGMSWLKLSSADLSVEILFFDSNELFAVCDEYNKAINQIVN